MPMIMEFNLKNYNIERKPILIKQNYKTDLKDLTEKNTTNPN